MRLLSVLLAALTITNVIADDSFCTKYAKIVFGKNATTLTGADEYNLIAAVVGRVVVGCDTNTTAQFGIVPTPGGIFQFYGKASCGNGVAKVNGLVSDPLNAPFFAGTAPNYQSVTGLQTLNDNANPSIPLAPPTFPSIRFVGVSGTNVTANPATTGSAGSEGLVQHLVSFFGQAFGCVTFNGNVNTPQNGSFIGKYNGVASMKTVHAKMNITKAVWDEFIGSFANTLISFGVSTADIGSMVKPVVAQFLLGGPEQICNDPSCDCAVVGGVTYTKANGTCSNPNGTPAPGTTTAPPTSGPTGTGGVTTSPPTTKAAASTVAVSAATIFGALLLAFL